MTYEEDRERKRRFARMMCVICGLAMFVIIAADAAMRHLQLGPY